MRKKQKATSPSPSSMSSINRDNSLKILGVTFTYHRSASDHVYEGLSVTVHKYYTHFVFYAIMVFATQLYKMYSIPWLLYLRFTSVEWVYHGNWQTASQ